MIIITIFRHLIELYLCCNYCYWFIFNKSSIKFFRDNDNEKSLKINLKAYTNSLAQECLYKGERLLRKNLPEKLSILHSSEFNTDET